jgi:hypothetical protein
MEHRVITCLRSAFARRPTAQEELLTPLINLVPSGGIDLAEQNLP